MRFHVQDQLETCRYQCPVNEETATLLLFLLNYNITTLNKITKIKVRTYQSIFIQWCHIAESNEVSRANIQQQVHIDFITLHSIRNIYLSLQYRCNNTSNTRCMVHSHKSNKESLQCQLGIKNGNKSVKTNKSQRSATEHSSQTCNNSKKQS